MHEKLELVHLYIADEEIVTTPEHPFWVINAEWCTAIEIRAGDILKLADGSTATVTATEYEKLDTPVKVYNFEVEDFHTYYVGEQAVLVHNSCRTKNKLHTDPNASGSHTVFKRGANGEITNYATYETNVQNPKGYILTKRFDRY